MTTKLDFLFTNLGLSLCTWAAARGCLAELAVTIASHRGSETFNSLFSRESGVRHTSRVECVLVG